MSEKDVEKLFPYYFFCTREDRLGPIIAKHTEVKVDGMMIRLCPESALKIVTDRDKAVDAIKKLAAWLEVIAPDLYDKFLAGELGMPNEAPNVKRFVAKKDIKKSEAVYFGVDVEKEKSVDCDHCWSLWGLNKGQRYRICENCGLEQVMLDAGDNGQWVDAPTESMPTGEAKTIADLKVKLDFEVDDSELKKIEVQTSEDFLLEVIAAARKEGILVEIQHMQVGDASRTTIVYPREGESTSHRTPEPVEPEVNIIEAKESFPTACTNCLKDRDHCPKCYWGGADND